MSGNLIMYSVYLQCVINVYNQLYMQLVCLSDVSKFQSFFAIQDEM